MASGKRILTSRVTADTLIRTGQTRVHWVTISNSHATEVATIELANSVDGASNDLWQMTLTDIAASMPAFHADFDPPMDFSTHLYADITSGTVSLTVGYSI
jgi:hypothetical protein